MSVLKKIAEFQKKTQAIGKETYNEFTKKKYADLSTIQLAIKPGLIEVGLAYTHTLSADGVVTNIYLADNPEDSISCTYPISFEGDPQKVGAKITYAKRYTLSAMLGLIIVNEIDLDQLPPEPETKKQKPKISPEDWAKKLKEADEAGFKFDYKTNKFIKKD